MFINDGEQGHADCQKRLEELVPYAPISQYQHNRTGEACPERNEGTMLMRNRSDKSWAAKSWSR
jgi:hypothetical protein